MRVVVHEYRGEHYLKLLDTAETVSGLNVAFELTVSDEADFTQIKDVVQKEARRLGISHVASID